MMTRKALRALTLATGLLLLVQVQCLLVPDDTEKGERVANRRPHVNITGGALSADSSGFDYKVQFQWSGSDDDGVVQTFEWAVDDTMSESAWQDTTGFSAQFRFSATESNPDNPSRFTGWHTFYIRAIDNEFSVSLPARQYFNARTIAPTTKITFPDLSQSQNPQMPRGFAVKWEGVDLDSSRPDRKPIYYEYKLVALRDIYTPGVGDSLLYAENRLLGSEWRGPKDVWIRIPETQRELQLSLLSGTGTSYAFAVRGVDEAGAIEPVLTQNVNYLVFDVMDMEPKPRVLVREESLGSHEFPTDGDIWTGPAGGVEVAAGHPLRFKWVGDARDYGSDPGNVNYALATDNFDPEDESRTDPRGIGGWIGWGKWTGNQVPFVFSNEDGGKVKTLYVYMRDIGDEPSSTRKCTIEMKVITYTLSKFALIVDDEIKSTVPDRVHTRFVKRSLLKRLYDFPQFGTPDTLKVYQITSSGVERGEPNAVSSLVLSDYQNVIWYVGNTNTTRTSFALTEGYGTNINAKHNLSKYVSAGGRLFMFGGELAGFLRQYISYPKDPCSNEDKDCRDSFFFKFLYLRNSMYSKNQGNNTNNQSCATQASGMIGARSLNPAYPDLYLDTSKWNPWSPGDAGQYLGGREDWEGVKASADEEVPQFEGLDSLYSVVTWDLQKPGPNNNCPNEGHYLSPGRDAVIAQRYQSTTADTLAGRQHGRIIFFDFEPYWYQENRVLDAGTAAVNWLVTGRDQ